MKSFKSSHLTGFISTELPMLSPKERKYVVMDYATIHKTREARESFTHRNRILKLLPPFNLILIPQRNFFMFKNTCKAEDINMNIQELINVIEEVWGN